MRKVILTFIFISLLFITYIKLSDIGKVIKSLKNESRSSPASHPASPPNKPPATLDEYVSQVKELCGELCDYTRKVTPGKILGTVSAKVNCDSVFAADMLSFNSGAKPPTWNENSQTYKDIVSHWGKVAIKGYYLDNRALSFGREEVKTFSKAHMESLISSWKSRKLQCPYPRVCQMTDEAAEVVGVEGKTILVIGSQSPWLESILISRGAAKVLTLEYGSFKSEHPSHEFIRPNEFRERYQAGTLDEFDAIFTYSSVEHSGLGRYGDPLNPWGDTLALAQAWCVSKPDAQLAVGVPYVKTGDRIEYNAHRVYGPVMYPFLATNWEAVWVEDDSKRTAAEGLYQPYFVFKKQRM